MIRMLLAVCAPFCAQELEGDFDAACERRMDAWRAYVAGYKPDYSDSAACLLPPADHRLKRPFAVVKGGKPACEIFLSDEQSEPCIDTAVGEFVDYVKAMTGVELPVCRNLWRATQKTGLNKLCVGKRALLRSEKGFMYAAPQFEPVLERLSGRDGYAIMTDGENDDRLYVFGARDKGTMNGLYALLENNTDIIWARPDESVGTIFVETPGELTFVWGEGVVSVPDTPGRGWRSFQDLPWMARNGCNAFNGGGGGEATYEVKRKRAYGALYTRFMGGHDIGQFLRGETRWRDVSQGNPCFTSEAALACMASNLLSSVRMAPDCTDYVAINIHDTWKGCTCEHCQEPIRCADGTVLTPQDDAFRSTQYWLFMNRLARALAREFPRMGIVSLAYFPTAAAPGCVLEPNVLPEFAPYVRVNDKVPIFAKENRSWLRRLVDWSKRARAVETYEYNGLGLGFPRPLAEVRAWDQQVMDPFVVSISPEYAGHGDNPKNVWDRQVWDIAAIELWVMTRLDWDPRQNVEHLRKHFIRRAYREAAPEIERVYGAIREEFFRSTKASTLGDAPLELAKTLLVDRKRDREIETLLSAALARKELHPKSRKLVKALQQRLMVQIEEARNLKNPMLAVPLLHPQGEIDFDSSVWEKGTEIASFGLTGKKRGAKASVHTSARVFHDSENLCIRVCCDDPSIGELPVYRGRAGVKEEVPEADHLEFYACDVRNPTAYYLFSLTPDGVWADLKGYDGSWDGEWRRATRRTVKGWEAFVKLPLKTIGGDDTTRELKALIWRECVPHGAVAREQSSWGGGSVHQPVTFGDMALMR